MSFSLAVASVDLRLSDPRSAWQVNGHHYLLVSNSYELAAAHWSLTDAYPVVHELTPPTNNEHAAGRSSSSQLSDVAPLQACGRAAVVGEGKDPIVASNPHRRKVLAPTSLFHMS